MKPSRICVCTKWPRAYYSIVSRLREADLEFQSFLPESDCTGCSLMLTTTDELGKAKIRALALEDLDSDPGIFKGQVISELHGSGKTVYVGVDPGKRMGLAVFYEDTKLASETFDSAERLCSKVADFAAALRAEKLVVRIGNGNPAMAFELAESLEKSLQDATIEIVDESGTTLGGRRVHRDELAAGRIAFRRGFVVHSRHGRPRSP